MEWQRTDRHRWKIAEDGFEGDARLKETNHGYIASVTVENTEFEMELMDEREFFEKRKDALKFLKERMRRESY